MAQLSLPRLYTATPALLSRTFSTSRAMTKLAPYSPSQLKGLVGQIFRVVPGLDSPSHRSIAESVLSQAPIGSEKDVASYIARCGKRFFDFRILAACDSQFGRTMEDHCAKRVLVPTLREHMDRRDQYLEQGGDHVRLITELPFTDAKRSFLYAGGTPDAVTWSQMEEFVSLAERGTPVTRMTLFNTSLIIECMDLPKKEEEILLKVARGGSPSDSELRTIQDSVRVIQEVKDMMRLGNGTINHTSCISDVAEVMARVAKKNELQDGPSFFQQSDRGLVFNEVRQMKLVTAMDARTYLEARPEAIITPEARLAIDSGLTVHLPNDFRLQNAAVLFKSTNTAETLDPKIEARLRLQGLVGD
jgi:hypothetical protein